MSYPTVRGRAVNGLTYREAQSCLGTKFANSTYKFFLTGTSTPANVYQNGALTTPFPITGNVASDNFGRFPPIYLDPSVIYRVQFFDNTNTQRWQVDPYISQLSTLGTSALSAFGMNIAPTGEVTVPAPNSGGSGITLTVKPGTIGSAALRLNGTLPGNSALIVNSSATTGAQTATFAASNKPGTSASAPAGWLPITCDGVQYYTPLWYDNSNFSPYTASASAAGEVINASSVLFGGNGITTATNGTATPGNWFAPVATNVGSGYYINITKTSGLSGLAFSAAQGSWTNITGSGLTISSNAQAPISGTYQLSSSVTGSPIVASGTITLSGNNGVQQPTYNGATPLVLGGDGTATLNGTGTSNWFAPTTASTGSGYYVSINQTGGAGSFTGLSGVTNITNGGLTIGVTGTAGTLYNASGTYSISSDAGGTVVLGSGTITLSGGSLVQSPNWSGTTPLKLNGDGSATLNGASTSSWYSPNASSVGSGYWVNITRTSGTTGVNFSAAQGSWTNITNSGLTIDMSGYTGDVGIISVGGTWQISSSSSGTPVLGSGTISLSVNAGTVTRTYNSGSGTETVPTGASLLTITVNGAGGGASAGTGGTGGGGGGGGGQAISVSIAVSGGQTLNYSVPSGGLGGVSSGGSPAAATVTGNGPLSAVSLTANSGAGAALNVGGSGGAASGGNSSNSGGNNGGNGGLGHSGSGGTSGGGTSGAAPGTNGSAPGAGGGGTGSGNTSYGNGGAGQIQFVYS